MAGEIGPREYVAPTSLNPLAERLAQLQALFPEAVREGTIDLDALRALLGNTMDEVPTHYNFTWAGKAGAIRALQTPSHATLAPAPQESVHVDTTRNVFIEGDNLEVLKLLYRSYFGQVKMIYIDPPYNTGNDFIYPDNFADPLDAYLKITGQKDGNGSLLTSNPETNGRYHSVWLSMMYPRLFLARQLLRDDGVIFISIDDHEVHNLRMLMNEVFGEENFVATVIWQKMYAPKSSAKHFSEDHDYILVYARNADPWHATLLPRTEQQDRVYRNPDNDPRGLWRPNNLAARNYYSKGTYSIHCPGGRVIEGPPKGSYWRIAEDKFWALDQEGRIWWGEDGNNVPAPKIYLSEVMQGRVPQTLWLFKEVGHTQEAKKELLEFVHFENTDNVLDTVKPTRLIQRMLQLATAPLDDDIVVDFFAGSATTAHAVLKQNHEDGGNRRFLCVQFPERLPIPEQSLKTIADIGRERIRQAITTIDQANGNTLGLSTREEPEDLGFRVFKLAPSTFKQWKPIETTDPDIYGAQLDLFVDTLAEGWTPDKVIYEVAIKEGYGLTVSVEVAHDTGDMTVYRVTDQDKEQSFYLCLDDSIDLDALKNLRLAPTDLFICRDSALTDTTAANLSLQCRLKTL